MLFVVYVGFWLEVVENKDFTSGAAVISIDD